ncbi:hypothetical protein ABZ543_13025 [Streptomyces roseifaciens]
MTTPTPGTPTPWGALPTPPYSQLPTVPDDLMKLAMALDQLLKDLVGGTTKPPAPLDPPVRDMSTAISSMQPQINAQGLDITTLKNDVAALKAVPWAAVAKVPEGVQINGDQTNPYSYLNYQIPTFAEKRLLLVFSNLTMRWNDSSSIYSLRARVRLRPDGSSTYADRMQAIGSGVAQTLDCSHMETIRAGDSVRVDNTIEVYGLAQPGKTIESRGYSPRMHLIALPWTGPDVPWPGL